MASRAKPAVTNCFEHPLHCLGFSPKTILGAFKRDIYCAVSLVNDLVSLPGAIGDFPEPPKVPEKIKPGSAEI